MVKQSETSNSSEVREPEVSGAEAISSTPDSWWVYVIETEQGHYYTGITTDVFRRFSEHCKVAGVVSDGCGRAITSALAAEGKSLSTPAPKGRGAKYFRSQIPRAVVYQAAFANRSEASKEEARIKKLSKRQKIALVDTARNARNARTVRND